MKTSRLVEATPPAFRLAYHVDFRTEATRNFKSDQSAYVDSSGATWTVENHGAAGATFGIGAAGLTIVGTAGTNVATTTRTAPILRTPMSGLGIDEDHQIIHAAFELSVTCPTSTAGLLLWEASSGNNNSRNYIGDSGGTARISCMATISGASTTVGSYDPPGGHPVVIRLESFTGLGGDWDWYGDGAVVTGAPVSRRTLQGLNAMHAVVARPFGWDRGAAWDPTSTGRLAFATANEATLVVRQVWINVLDLSSL